MNEDLLEKFKENYPEMFEWLRTIIFGKSVRNMINTRSVNIH